MPTGPESALRPGEDPRERARALRRVREAALGDPGVGDPGLGDPGAGGGVPVESPRPVIRASWQRSRGAGLSPNGGHEVPALGLPDLERRRADSGLGEVLPLLRERLLPVADAAGQIMVVVDPAGRVLWREGGAAVRRRADGLGFVEGSAWDERSVGTNAIGTSLVEGAPVHVFAGEHYAEDHQPWTCAAAPLHDPLTGALLGAVDLSGPAHTVHATTIALVAAVARLAELEVRLVREQALERLRVVAAPIVARISGPALAVTGDGLPAAAAGLAPPGRIALPDGLRAGAAWLPGLGRCAVEPLPGGWLLRPEPGDASGVGPDDQATHLVLDLTADPPRARVATPSGSWERALRPRHAELLALLARHPEGRSAAQLAVALFGDASHRVAVRAELSRLRRELGPLLRPQPYRFADGVLVRLLPPT